MPPQGARGLRIEFDAEHLESGFFQAKRQAAAITPEAEDDDVGLAQIVTLRRHRQFTVRALALESAQPGRQLIVEGMRIEDHVGRQCDGDQTDQRGQPQRTTADMAKRDAHGDDDNRKLADLRDRQTAEKAGALAIAHVAHDGHDDQRVADQHEQRQHQRRPDLAAEGREVELGAQVDEEEQQQEVADAGQP